MQVLVTSGCIDEKEGVAVPLTKEPDVWAQPERVPVAQVLIFGMYICIDANAHALFYFA